VKEEKGPIFLWFKTAWEDNRVLVRSSFDDNFSLKWTLFSRSRCGRRKIFFNKQSHEFPPRWENASNIEKKLFHSVRHPDLFQLSNFFSGKILNLVCLGEFRLIVLSATPYPVSRNWKIPALLLPLPTLLLVTDQWPV